MIAAFDVGYFSAGTAGLQTRTADGDADLATAAAVLFKDWQDPEPLAEYQTRVSPVAPYEPGFFFQRELPCLLQLIAEIPNRPQTVVIDGHVWLWEAEPGLGAHLHAALDRSVDVIGVAKSSFRGSPDAVHVFRGCSRRPLFVTAAGPNKHTAATYVEAMHGDFRIPTLLKRADTLSRQVEGPGSAP